MTRAADAECTHNIYEQPSECSDHGVTWQAKTLSRTDLGDPLLLATLQSDRHNVRGNNLRSVDRETRAKISITHVMGWNYNSTRYVRSVLSRVMQKSRRARRFIQHYFLVMYPLLYPH